jgi:hypothetical protein
MMTTMKRGALVFLGLAGMLLLAAGEARASCTAQVTCQVTVIQCSGTSTCSSGPDWVQCDNHAKIFCPVCQAQTTCCDGRLIFCNGYTSCQEFPGEKVVCDGHVGGICPNCPG